jgi:hypothetical protein
MPHRRHGLRLTAAKADEAALFEQFRAGPAPMTKAAE